jgi:diguanylate cyclase (GGDEF)-like protein/PAS domain S-box-containing protein
MLETDLQGTCIDLNPAALELLGLEYEAAIGENILTLLGHDAHLHIAGKSSGPDTIRVGALPIFPSKGRELTVELSVSVLESRGNPTVVYFLRDITDELALEQQLRDSALRDPLTGLPNRQAIEEEIDLTLRHIGRGAPPAVLCFLDLDNFKDVNDSCGHAAGDALLKRIADVFKKRIRATDAVGRVGGDEFAILLNHCALGDALDYMEDLQEKLRNLDFCWDERAFEVSLSAGLTPITPNTSSVADALSEADCACFAAKSAGRNQTRVYSKISTFAPVNTGADSDVLDTLKHALWADAISLSVQPMRDLRSAEADKPTGEILLRLKNSDDQLIPPTRLFALASRYGLAPQLDRWIIKRISDWLLDPEPHARRRRFYVNIAGLSVMDESFVGWLQDNVPASIARFLGFEIKEADAMRHPQAAGRMITAMRSMGCGAAIDHVSGAVDALSFILCLPLTLMKLHPAFAKMSTPGEPLFIQAEALVRIAHQASLPVAVTHVESEHALDCVQRLGADFAQGVVVSPAVPLIEASLRSRGDDAGPTRAASELVLPDPPHT